jgi:hypothetical protein
VPIVEQRASWIWAHAVDGYRIHYETILLHEFDIDGQIVVPDRDIFAEIALIDHAGFGSQYVKSKCGIRQINRENRE